MSRRLSAGLIALCLVLFVALAACTNNNGVAPNGATFTPVPPSSTPEVVPTPQPGLTVVTGQLIDSNTKAPYTNTVVRLAEIIHIDPGDQGTWMIDDATSPGDYTDDQGHFIISNVEAQDYVLVIGDFHTRYAIVTAEPDTALVVTTTADQIVNVETVDVVLP